MKRYNAKVETSTGEFKEIDIVVIPVMDPGTYDEVYWVVFPTELYGLVTERYDPADLLTLKGFIKAYLYGEYPDVLWVALDEEADD